MNHNMVKLEATLREASFALNSIPNTRLHGHARAKNSYMVASLIDQALDEIKAPRFVRYGWTTGTRTMCGDTVHGSEDAAGNYEPWLAETKAEADESLADDLKMRIESYREDDDPEMHEEADRLEEDGDDEDFVAYVGIDAEGNVHDLDPTTGEPTGFTYERADR
jgi:hypothetical protein